MSRYRLITALCLSSITLSSCGGGGSAATSTSNGGSSGVTYQLSDLDASSFKNCEYFGYATSGSTCVAAPGSGESNSVYSESSFSHTNTRTVFSGFDFIRLAEAQAILAKGNTSNSEMPSNGSYSYTDDSDTLISGNVSVALIGSGVGISNPDEDRFTVSESTQTATDQYRTSSTAEYANFVADNSTNAVGKASGLIDALTGTSANSNYQAVGTAATSSPYIKTSFSGDSDAQQLQSHLDYIKNIDPENNGRSDNNYTEISLYKANTSYSNNPEYRIYNDTEAVKTNYGLNDFMADTANCTATNCRATISQFNDPINPAVNGSTSTVDARIKSHDVDYFIFEDGDSANGTALAALISGPKGTDAGGSANTGTFNAGMATATEINSYKTMFDYGKYFAFYALRENSATSGGSGDRLLHLENYQYFGSYKPLNDGDFDYDGDGSTTIPEIDNYDSRVVDGGLGGTADGVIKAYDQYSVDRTIPEMFLLQDGNGYQTYQAMLAAIPENEIILLNDQFRNYYYETASKADGNGGGTEYNRTNDLNIYSYSALGAFRTDTDDVNLALSTNNRATLDSAITAAGRDAYVVEKDFATVADVNRTGSSSTLTDTSNYYSNIIDTMKSYSGASRSTNTKAFVIPTDPSMLKMAIMTDNADTSSLNFTDPATVAGSDSDVDQTKIATTYKNFLFVAGANVRNYTLETSDSYVENFDTGLGQIDTITLTNTSGSFLSNDHNAISASITGSTAGDLGAAIDEVSSAASSDIFSNYDNWDCAGLKNCMIAPGNVYSYTKYNRYTAHDSMDDSYIPFLDGDSSSNSLSGEYYVNSDPGYSNTYDDGVRDTENLATAYVTGAVSMILGAYYEEYTDGTLTIDDIVGKMLNYATPATKIYGCDAYDYGDSPLAGTIDCGVGMLNVQRTLEASCNDDSNIDLNGECSVTTSSGSSQSLALSSLTLGPAFGNSLNSEQANNILKQAVYYDNYNFRYSARLDERVQTNNTNYLLENYLNAGNSTRQTNRLSPLASFSLDMSYDEYEQTFEDGSTTRYFSGPVDLNQQQNLAFSNYSFHTNLGNKASFNFTMESANTNSLAPNYLNELSPAVSFDNANAYMSLAGNSVNFSELNYQFNKNLSVNFGYVVEGETALTEGSNLMFNNLQLSYKNTEMTFSFGSLIESDSMLSTEGSAAFSFENDVNTKYYGVSVKQNLTGKLSLIASYNIGNTETIADKSSIFQDFSDIKSEETILGLVHNNKKGTKLGFIYKEPMRVTEGDVLIQVPTKQNANGSYNFTNGLASLTPDGKERDLEFFMEKQINANHQLKLNLLKRVEPYHIAGNDDEDMVLFSLSKKF